ncbi:hypothetical protein EL06_00185 [Salmonella enterica subsp. diarizonae]|uniref:Uncharacterized protein n=1 Tax=Salmonella diarizonae TaxID=59204 RepID=A0A6C8XQJ7_SALDZ|nr:hypothetical protein [Salmonella enterica]EBV2371686.1 hypothetical protein [Salmonella enterica subsp. enterica serovar Enteritidis]EGX1466861.1 hypothetical protein [Salmonella enterica]MIE67965.1 hypothetical protein [Salmonella enterica subsp. diarizonae]
MFSIIVSDRVVVENNTLGKDKIYDINPMLKIGVEGVDGDPLKGGGIAKYTINKGQKNKNIEGARTDKLTDSQGKHDIWLLDGSYYTARNVSFVEWIMSGDNLYRRTLPILLTHRSGCALLTYPAPASGTGVEAL